MKHLQSIIFFLALAMTGYTQVTPPAALSAKRVSALEAMVIRDKKIDSVSIDTSLKGNRHGVLASQAAIRAFVEARKNYNRPVYGSDFLTATNDSTLGLLNYHAFTGVAEYSGYNSSGVKGLFPIPSNGGNGDLVRTTAAALKASSGLSTNVVYFITDADRQGQFTYVGVVADQSSDNLGASVIVTTDLKQYKRVASEKLNVLWFGAKPDGVVATGADTATGTDNAIPFNLAFRAALDGQIVWIPSGPVGKFYATHSELDTFDVKKMYVINDGNIATNKRGGFRIYPRKTAGGDLMHVIDGIGGLWARFNQPSQTSANYLAGTGPNWPSYTSAGIEIVNTYRN